MAYTSPPPTAEPLLKEKPFGECTFQLSPIAVQRLHSYSTTPPWHADRRSAQGVRSTTEGEIFKGTDGACADPGTRIFPATGWPGPLPVLFNRLLRHTQVLWYFLDSRKYRPPLVPRPLLHSRIIHPIAGKRQSRDWRFLYPIMRFRQAGSARSCQRNPSRYRG